MFGRLVGVIGSRGSTSGATVVTAATKAAGMAFSAATVTTSSTAATTVTASPLLRSVLPATCRIMKPSLVPSRACISFFSTTTCPSQLQPRSSLACNSGGPVASAVAGSAAAAAANDGRCGRVGGGGNRLDGSRFFASYRSSSSSDSNRNAASFYATRPSMMAATTAGLTSLCRPSSSPIFRTLMDPPRPIGLSVVAPGIVIRTAYTRGREYQPNNLKRKRTHGFLARLRSRTGRQVLKRRRMKGRKHLSH